MNYIFAAAVFCEIWVAQIFKKKYQRQIVGSKMLQCIFHCIKQVEKAVEFIMEHCLKVHLIEVGCTYISVKPKKGQCIRSNFDYLLDSTFREKCNLMSLSN